MNQNKDTGVTIFFSAIILLIVGFIIYYMFFVTDWSERLTFETKEPYDISLLHELIATSETEFYFENTESFVHNTLDTLDSGYTYIFVGHALYLDSTDAHSLYRFIERGNNAIISTNESSYMIERLLWDSIQPPYTETYYYDSVNISLENAEGDYTEYPYVFRVEKSKIKRYWSYYEFPYEYYDSTYNTLKYQELGFVEPPYSSDYGCNLYAVQVGSGQILMHCEPLLFANYYFKDDLGFDYVNGVLSQVLTDKIIWERYHNIYRYNSDYNNYEQIENQGGSPLAYIFKQPALKYAWYTLLISTVLFFIFKSKREQRIIPIIPPVENTSIEFAKSLGTMYFKSKSPKYIAIEMMKLFSNFNRRKYHLSGKSDNYEFISALAKKSKFTEEKIKEIYLLERKVVYNPQATFDDLTKLYNALQNYYQKTRS